MVRAAHSNRMSELCFALSQQLQEASTRVLFGDEQQGGYSPERGFLGIIHAGEGVIRRTLFLRKIVPQDPGWVAWKRGGGLAFSAQYFSRAVSEVAHIGGTSGILIVHSHPGGELSRQAPTPSSPDLQSERELLCANGRAMPVGSILAAGIMGGNGRWRVREYSWPRPSTVAQATKKSFGPYGGKFRDAKKFRITGLRQTRFQGAGAASSTDLTAADSTVRLWGVEGQRILQDLRIGLAGAGGVGSILTEYLARLGVGEVVLVDFDRLGRDNLNRASGAHRSDVGKPKVSYLAKVAKASATAPGFKVRPYPASVVEWAGLRPLLDCDVIMNAADSAFARQVLDHVSYAFEIPVIDGGTKLIVESDGRIVGRSQVSGAGPGSPCLECQGVYTREEATLARESPKQQGPFRYLVADSAPIGGGLPRAPSVISHNGLVASLMVQRLLRTALGFPPEGNRTQQRFYAESGDMRWGPVEECAKDCPKRDWIGLGETHPIPVGVDPFLDELRQRTSPGFPAARFIPKLARSEAKIEAGSQGG